MDDCYFNIKKFGKTKIMFREDLLDRITIEEGKNREIRKIMLHLGLQVNRLIRVGFGPFNLDKMQSKEIIEIPKKNIKNLFPLDII
jgi:16S rRNA U516 pseudouridylate synthase RsuA-like enzyme